MPEQLPILGHIIHDEEAIAPRVGRRQVRHVGEGPQRGLRLLGLHRQPDMKHRALPHLTLDRNLAPKQLHIGLGNGHA